MSLKEDILIFIKKQGLNTEQAAGMLGVTRKTFYNYLDKLESKTLDSKVVEVLLNRFDFNDELKKRIKLTIKVERIEGISALIAMRIELGIELHSEYFSGILHDTKYIILFFTKDLPPKHDYRVLEVYSQFMSPTIATGDLIVVEELVGKLATKAYDYYIYVIVLQNEVILSRIKKKKNGLWLLRMDNGEEVEDFDPKNITNLFVVRKIYNANEAGPIPFGLAPSLFNELS